MNPLPELPAHALPLPGVRRIAADRPLRWLSAGWRDLKANPLPSLAYGLLFALAGDLIILATLDRPHLLTVSISGFFLVAPLLAAGLNELLTRPLNIFTAQHTQRPGAGSRTGHARGARRCGP